MLVLGATALIVASVVPIYAPHAFGAEFDPNRPLVLKGSVLRVEWVNPHTWTHLEVTTDSGTKEVRMVEGGTPNSLRWPGLTRDTIKNRQVIVVDGYQAKDRSNRANGRDVTFELGSSGTGAPYDREPRPVACSGVGGSVPCS